MRVRGWFAGDDRSRIGDRTIDPTTFPTRTIVKASSGDRRIGAMTVEALLFMFGRTHDDGSDACVLGAARVWIWT